MSRSSVFALSLVLAGGVLAGDLSRHQAFSRLHRISDPYQAFYESFILNGFTIVGERILLENGQLTVSIQKVANGEFQMSNVGATSIMPLNEGFFADPLTAGVNNFLTQSTVTIASLKAKATLVNEQTNENELINVELKDIRLVHAQKALRGHMKVLVFPADFTGKSSFSKPDKKLTVTVESISIGGIPVPLDLAFFVLKHFINFDFITISKPNIIFDLGAFLPGQP
jgi:hypothetical protein